MWTKKNTDQDVLFESGTAWFAAPYNVSSITKPKKIKDWEGDSTFYDVISKAVRWNRPRAEKQLDDLSDIALDYTLTVVKAKQTFTTGAKGENLPPTVFHADRDGVFDGEIIQLRSLVDKGGDTDVKAQESQIDKWRKSVSSPVTDDIANFLKQACELTDSEMIYVRELIRVYDLVRCYMVMWVVDESFKNHINSERVAAVYSGNDYVWDNVKQCVLKTLVDISPEARLATFINYKRPNSETAILFLARQMAVRSKMEGDHVPKDRRIILPESVYLNYTVGQMSDREILDYDIPACGDDFEKKHTDGKTWTLAKVKEHVDKAHKPVRFQGANTAITKLIAHIRSPPEPGKPEKAKQKYRNEKTGRGDRQLTQKKPYEVYKNMPPQLKRPNPKDQYKGKPISSKAQQQLYDDIKNGNCTRCHKAGHWRGSPKCEVKTPHSWEPKIDEKKAGYWTGLAKFQGKLTENPEGRWTEIDELEYRPQLLQVNRFACLDDSNSDEVSSDNASQDSGSDGSFLPDMSFASASVSDDELRDSIDDAAETAEMDKWFEPSHGNPEPPSTYFQQPEPALPLPEGPTFTMPIELYYEDWKPGGGPTQFRGDQRSGGGGERVVAAFCFCGARGRVRAGAALMSKVAFRVSPSPRVPL